MDKRMRRKGHTLIESLLVLILSISTLNLSPIGRWLNYEATIRNFEEVYLHRQYLSMLTHRTVELPAHTQLNPTPSFNEKGNINSAYTLIFHGQLYTLSFITGRLYEKREQSD
jgi:hypothetical protein